MADLQTSFTGAISDFLSSVRGLPNVIKISAKVTTMQNTNILLFVRSLSLTNWRSADLHMSDFRQDIIDAAINQCRKRLQACVRANDGHFEHLLWTNSCEQLAFFMCFWFKWLLSIMSTFYCVDARWSI